MPTPWIPVHHDASCHAMTCDVEDYFQVSAFSDVVSRDDWDRMTCRIPQNVDRILELFSAHNTKATFFTLGWVAQNHADVVRRIANAGHEIASHGMAHTRVWQQDDRKFYRDASDARKLLQDVSGQIVAGYRAASWSIDERTPWAHEMLAEAGYSYSSSIYPISHDHFGSPNAVRHPHYVKDTGILEIPASVVRVFGRNVPAAGGGYFRLYPFALTRRLIREMRKQCAHPYVFYFHPWEMDPGQPRVSKAPAKSRFRHYLNLGKFEGRLARLLAEFRWDRMDRVYFESIQASDKSVGLM